MGTVMGSKNLKAIAVRGKNRTQIADKNALGVLAKWGAETMPKSPAQGFGQFQNSSHIYLLVDAAFFKTQIDTNTRKTKNKN